MADVISPSEHDFSAYMELTEHEQKVRPATDWRQMYLDRISGRMPRVQGANLPWAKAKGLVTFAPGEVTLWVGINGHGKSLIIGQCALSWAAQGEKVCIASFEMKPDKTLERLAHQFLDTRFPDERQGERFMDWSDGKLWLYDQHGSINARTVIAAIRYCAEKVGITQFIVDNLIKCVKSDEDYEGQKTFVDDLTTVAKDHNIHIHLIHHSRKGPDEFSPPRKMDSLGSGSVANLVDNMLIVWRNKKKEDEKHKDKPIDELSPDAMVLCEKNRHGDWEGRMSLYFHHRSTQFLAHPRDSVMNLESFPHDGLRMAA